MITLPLPRKPTRPLALLSAVLGLLAAAPAQGANLQAVNDWGAIGVPADVNMYMYLPTTAGTNAPVLVLLHSCGATATTVFGQASGLVTAADQYGFIMVVPSSGRCWDVESPKGLTRDGGGDSTAIRQMVKYAITSRNANADRVYVTGVQGGAMMTELLLAQYPDVFKAGSAFAGFPAGCRAASETSTGFSSQCASGRVTHTAQEWGDLARAMYPGQTGRRPRIQLFHGDADVTVLYLNFNEAIKQWTNVLGLNPTPDSTSTGLTLGTHQATRQSWQDSCGYTVIDAFTSIGGDHGPSDALFPAQYVIPFLGLDKAGAVDPHVTACLPDAGVTATGGVLATGGAPSSGGVVSTGGVAPSGGVLGTGGVIASGGVTTTGGSPSTGGAKATGGIVGIDAASGSGGVITTGGVSAGGNVLGTGGVSNAGGQTTTGDAGVTFDAKPVSNDGGGLGIGDTNSAITLGDTLGAPEVARLDGPRDALNTDGPIAAVGGEPDAGDAKTDAPLSPGPSSDASVTPKVVSRHPLYEAPSCDFGRGKANPFYGFVALALLDLTRRSNRRRSSGPPKGNGPASRR